MVFVGGVHRSGTTPLARVLATHPEISGLTSTGAPEDEGQHLQDVYPKIRTHGGLGRFALSSDAHLTDKSPLCSGENATRLLQSWQPFWDLSRPYLLEKSPPNIVMSRFLQGLFPESSFVMVVRNPIVVALASRKWNPWFVSRKGYRRRTLAGHVRNWIAAHETLERDLPHLKRVLVVNYEELVANPQPALSRIQDFLGLDSAIDGSPLQASLSSRYQEQWAHMRAGNPLQRTTRRRIEHRYSAEVARFGYDVSDLGAFRPWHERQPS
ncbi:MAG: sulfotransferase family protein [Nocardioidaceae bacterium]